MALSVTNSGTLTADGTEQTLGTERTDGKTYVLQLDLTNLAAGDTVEIRAKVKVVSAGTARTLYKAVYANAQAYPALQTPPIPAPYSITFTLKQLNASYRTFDYALISM